MRFDNQPVDDSVNVTPASPLRDFVSLALAAVVLAAVLAVTLVASAGLIARHVPFAVEAALARRFFADPPTHPEAERALQSLADTIAASMKLPPEIRPRVHFADEPTVNALATLGGHIVVYRGLVEKLASEDALAAVLAHEIAHVRHRDPVTGLGRGVALSLSLGTLSASAGDVAGRMFIGAPATLTTLRFGRDQEREADAAALEGLTAAYGHLAGAVELFEVFRKLRTGRAEPPPLLATHPGSDERSQRVRDWAEARGVPLSGTVRPLPRDLQLPQPSDVKSKDG